MTPEVDGGLMPIQSGHIVTLRLSASWPGAAETLASALTVC